MSIQRVLEISLRACLWWACNYVSNSYLCMCVYWLCSLENMCFHLRLLFAIVGTMPIILIFLPLHCFTSFSQGPKDIGSGKSLHSLPTHGKQNVWMLLFMPILIVVLPEWHFPHKSCHSIQLFIPVTNIEFTSEERSTKWKCEQSIKISQLVSFYLNIYILAGKNFSPWQCAYWASLWKLFLGKLLSHKQLLAGQTWYPINKQAYTSVTQHYEIGTWDIKFSQQWWSSTTPDCNLKF